MSAFARRSCVAMARSSSRFVDRRFLVRAGGRGRLPPTLYHTRGSGPLPQASDRPAATVKFFCMRRWRLAVLGVVVLLAYPVAHAPGQRTPRPAAPTGPALRLGALLPLSGPGAWFGTEIRQGLELAAQEVSPAQPTSPDRRRGGLGIARAIRRRKRDEILVRAPRDVAAQHRQERRRGGVAGDRDAAQHRQERRRGGVAGDRDAAQHRQERRRGGVAGDRESAESRAARAHRAAGSAPDTDARRRDVRCSAPRPESRH